MLTLIIFLSRFIPMFWHTSTQYLLISFLSMSWSDNSTIFFTSIQTPTHFIRVTAIANVCSWLLSPKRNNLSLIICPIFVFSFYFLLFSIHLFWHFCLFSMLFIIRFFGPSCYLLFLIFTWVWFHVWQRFFIFFIILFLSLCLLCSPHTRMGLLVMKLLFLWCCLYWSFYFWFSLLLSIYSFNYLILILIFTLRLLYCLFLLLTFQISIFYLFTFSNFFIQW